MTHEFKTPLSSILIASNYLRKQDLIKSDAKLGKYTGIIIDQSNKLNKHIEKVLNIAKSDSAPLALAKTNMALKPIIENVVENIRLKYENLKVQLDFPEKDIYILADEFHFTNLVYNVIDNSVKYSEKSPLIRIKATEGKKPYSLNLVITALVFRQKKLHLFSINFIGSQI